MNTSNLNTFSNQLVFKATHFICLFFVTLLFSISACEPVEATIDDGDVTTIDDGDVTTIDDGDVTTIDITIEPWAFVDNAAGIEFGWHTEGVFGENTKYLSCADRGLDEYSKTINVNDAWNDYVATTTSPDYQEFETQFCAANPHPPVDSVELNISCQMWSFPTPTQSGPVIDWTANSNNPAQINYHACQLKLQKETSFTGSTPPHPPTPSMPTKNLSCEDQNLDDYSKTINVNDAWNDYVATTTSPDYQEFETQFCAANPHATLPGAGTPSCQIWTLPTPVQNGGIIDWTASASNPAEINYFGCQLFQAPSDISSPAPAPAPPTPIEEDGKIDGYSKYLTCEDQNLDDYSKTIHVNDAWNDYAASTSSPDYQDFEALFCAANPHSPAPGLGAISCRMWSFPTPTQNGTVIDWTASASNPAEINYFGCQLKAEKAFDF